MWHQSAIFEKSWPPFCQIWIFFTNLKLWIESGWKFRLNNLAVKGLKLSDWKVGDSGLEPHSGFLVSKKQNASSPLTRNDLHDRDVACSASDRWGSNFESCVWRAVSSHSSYYPQSDISFKLQNSVYLSYFHPLEVVGGCNSRSVRI